MDQAGLVTDLYIPPRKLPSWFTHPKLRWTALKRRFQMVGLNTYMVVKLRRDIGSQRFLPLQWKETALMLYERMNECFVARDLPGLARVTSRWVYGPLSARAERLPRDCVYSWRIDKLLRRPQVLSIIPLALPGKPTQFVQVVYRIESRQELSKANVAKGLNSSNSSVERVTRDVCDQVAFIFDTAASPPKGLLIGSLFETPVTGPMPDPSMSPTTRTEVMRAMTIRGDVFRSEPEYAAVKNSS